MKKNFINRILQNTRKPQGFWGRMILRSMNTGHAPLAAWAFTHLDWRPDWKVLDIGCGGGANIAHMLKRCPQGQVYGVDISPESVAFARQKNKAFLDERCFILQGTASDLPFEGDTFDVATAFETLYFWEDPDKAFCEILRILRACLNFI